MDTSDEKSTLRSEARRGRGELTAYPDAGVLRALSRLCVSQGRSIRSLCRNSRVGGCGRCGGTPTGRRHTGRLELKGARARSRGDENADDVFGKCARRYDVGSELARDVNATIASKLASHRGALFARLAVVGAGAVFAFEMFFEERGLNGRERRIELERHQRHVRDALGGDGDLDGFGN